jgi:hypothetical protein
MCSCGDSRPRLSTGQSPVLLVLVLLVWDGHSCPSPLTLMLILLVTLNRGDHCRRQHNRGRAALKRRAKPQGGARSQRHENTHSPPPTHSEQGRRPGEGTCC